VFPGIYLKRKLPSRNRKELNPILKENRTEYFKNRLFGEVHKKGRKQ
jgi:hypothetical protein